MTHVTVTNGPNGPIGYLTPRGQGYGAVCANHRDPRARNTPLYYVNVWPYSQACAVCHTVLVQGGKGWPELFDGSDPLTRDTGYVRLVEAAHKALLRAARQVVEHHARFDDLTEEAATALRELRAAVARLAGADV